jgi:glycosyltransferase involved in cell wall biosynthesis
MRPRLDALSSPLRILANFESFPAVWSLPTGESGTSRIVNGYAGFAQGMGECDVILVDGDPWLVLKLCALFLVFPARRRLLVAVDLVMGEVPAAWHARLTCFLKKLLFRRVDRFINYFKSSEAYAKFYGITPERSSYVPFKPNLRDRCETTFQPDGDYVLCFGRSRRDYDSFLQAVETLPYPAAIPRPDLARLRAAGSRFSRPLDRLPLQVKLLDDDGSPESMMRIVAGAKIVVLPMLPTNLLAGIGVYLSAMVLGKCVIITSGAGATDILTDEALFVPPGDSTLLAKMIQRAWEDDELRFRTAQSGYRYAMSLGGRPELYRRMLEALVAWIRSAGSTTGAATGA